MNWLLEQAEINDQAYLKQVDEAIAAGAAPPQRKLGWNVESDHELKSYGLSDLVQQKKGKKTKTVDPEAVKAWREHVLRLRKRIQ
jgi:hypothetical protein